MGIASVLLLVVFVISDYILADQIYSNQSIGIAL
jgi:hypothetical protein